MLTFTRRGEGWGEELLPRAELVRLPVDRHGPTPDRRYVKRVNALLDFLASDAVGMTPAEASASVDAATAWRVTAGGARATGSHAGEQRRAARA